MVGIVFADDDEIGEADLVHDAVEAAAGHDVDQMRLAVDAGFGGDLVEGVDRRLGFLERLVAGADHEIGRDGGDRIARHDRIIGERKAGQVRFEALGEIRGGADGAPFAGEIHDDADVLDIHDALP